MTFRFVVALGLSTTALAAQGQQQRELLQEIDRTYADRLEAYNSVFIQDVTYSAARYRIVKPNADLFVSDDEIWITPFDDGDVEPIRITADKVRRDRDFVVWSGRVELENPIQLPPGIDPIAEQYPSTAYHASLSMYWWDLDESGNAQVSMMNRFEFSPNWIFDDSDRLVFKPGSLDVLNENNAGPPQTPEQIARHKALLEMQKHAFRSVSADLRSPAGVHYMLVPLEYTPQYSVMIEEDPDLRVLVPIDGGVSALTPEQQRRGREYVEFVQRLPREDNKAVLMDLE